MFKTILKSLGAAFIITLLHFAIVNYFYWRYNMHQTMWENIHYYFWVPYAEGTGVMFVAAFIFEMIRNLIKRKQYTAERGRTSRQNHTW